ncbi:hypothetical protein BO71DRAFT_403383 [Aspergillus ellipticus CBS 707.79]|uniref:Uncharacterized protein n=1 Tax=Aspergillus ellipticus CBS 707.79 TaxID=1448320 RepID=A0A319CV76_9EURO|nr:hypothetical protein BO71DRAFT_403383 [Aspergillus ellipticus CBS 707.79]
MVQFLVERGANINAKTISGHNILMLLKPDDYFSREINEIKETLLDLGFIDDGQNEKTHESEESGYSGDENEDEWEYERPSNIQSEVQSPDESEYEDAEEYPNFEGDEAKSDQEQALEDQRCNDEAEQPIHPGISA